MNISFAGHSTVLLQDEVERIVENEIEKLIINENNAVFYLGGYGEFDNICARACRTLKKKYSYIELVYVAPYMNKSEKAKFEKMQRSGLCDCSVYPPIESTPLRYAISKRNEWMMLNADVIIAYVKRNFGGAYKSLQFAKRRKKIIINIAELT